VARSLSLPVYYFPLLYLFKKNNEQTFIEWWRKSSKKVPKDKRKGIHTVVVFGVWMLWNHKNAGFFEGTNPNTGILIHLLDDEQYLWCLVGSMQACDIRSSDRLECAGLISLLSCVFQLQLGMLSTFP
jgi:hypothetical protein